MYKEDLERIKIGTFLSWETMKMAPITQTKKQCGIIIGVNTDTGWDFSVIELTENSKYEYFPSILIDGKLKHMKPYSIMINVNRVTSINISDNPIPEMVYMQMMKFYMMSCTGHLKYNPDSDKFYVENAPFDPVMGFLYGYGMSNTLPYFKPIPNCYINTTTGKIHSEKKSNPFKLDKPDEQSEEEEKEEPKPKRKYKKSGLSMQVTKKLDDELKEDVDTIPRREIIIGDDIKQRVNKLFLTFIKYAKDNALPIRYIYDNIEKINNGEYIEPSKKVKYVSRKDIELLLSLDGENLVKLGVSNTVSTANIIKGIIVSIEQGEPHKKFKRKNSGFNPFENKELRDLIIEMRENKKSPKIIYQEIKDLEPNICSISSFYTFFSNFFSSEESADSTFKVVGGKKEIDGFLASMKENKKYKNYKNIDRVIRFVRNIYNSNEIAEYISGARKYRGEDVLEEIVFYNIIFKRMNSKTQFKFITLDDRYVEYFNSRSIKQICDDLSADFSTHSDALLAFCKIYSHYKKAKNSELKALKNDPSRHKELAKKLYPIFYLARGNTITKDQRKMIEDVMGISYDFVRQAIPHMAYKGGNLCDVV